MKLFSTLAPPASGHPLAVLTMDTYRILAKETDLSPNNPLINRTLHHFVQTVSGFHATPDADAVLDLACVRSVLPSLRDLLGRAEGEMEKYYAEWYNGLDSIRLGELIQFMYWENYVTLVREEMNVLERVIPDWKEKKIAFVGSGPLPISPLLFHLSTALPVICFDSDSEAVEHSRCFIEKCGLQENMQVIQARGEEADYAEFSLVFVASLVQPKEKVLSRIRATHNAAWVAVRSSEGVYRLLYDPVSPRLLDETGYEVWGKTAASSLMINTTLFLKPKA